jgi:DNA-binding HxlR family transcriptional regulator
MTENEAIELFKCLSDRSRLQILKSLSIEPMYVERLSKRLGLTPSTISFHLKKLENAGIVYAKKEQYYLIYHLVESVLKENILELIKDESSELSQQKEREEGYEKKVLDSFFEYGKLKSIPVQRKKRRIVLIKISKAFEAGKQYTEKEVNLIIADYHDDFCTLRREMLAEQIMERDGTIYWRKEENASLRNSEPNLRKQ